MLAFQPMQTGKGTRSMLTMFRLAAAAGVVLALPAAGGGTHTLAVSATVLSKGNCKFDTRGPTALAFGGLDPTSNVDKVASVSIPYSCGGGPNPGVSWGVTSDDGLYETGPGAPRMRHAVTPAEFLKYSLNFPLFGTVPKNTNQTLTVTGTVFVADIKNAAVGDYLDTVVLTIAP